MKVYSELFKKEYEAEDCIHIPNMKQNYKYLSSGHANEDLVDIVCGRDDKLIFVWRKSPIMMALYDAWCQHKL